MKYFFNPFTILPHGRLNLQTAIVTEPNRNPWNVVACDGDDGVLELWRNEAGKFKVVRSSWNSNKQAGMQNKFMSVSSRREMKGIWTFVAVVPVQELQQLQELTNKKVVDVACYK